jgi:co-chaperonin GroES (HSP10)|tara:strand:- start:4552 stop:4974 length:423 start_codon:yes stop_codon:yes gene_type:complete
MQHQPMSKALKNDEWIDDKEVADPDTLPNLTGFHVLVRPVSVKRQTKGGIILPDSTREDIAYLTTVGRVIALGDLAYEDKTKFPKGPWCKVGDYVSYGKHSGVKLRYKGVRLLLIFDDQVIMTINDPTDLDTSYNLSSGG